ncbi:MAG: class I SAM-dependent methyltransferase, partial [Cyanobacteria bacterium P01_A01_bin.17]
MPATSDISVQLKGVPETLLITLYARAAESQKSEPILQDPKAVEIAHQLDYDFSKFEPGWSSQLGCVIRAGHIDRIVQVFIKAHPEAVVINLGAGLCTRYSRLETPIDGSSVYYRQGNDIINPR